ncbi:MULTISPECIES: ABC transporter permease [unclassified Shewanella]|uniref:ABC transporter permease n=1 Tax=unclassified Shewanella TaxID=196818 RepID=UPI0035540C88
MNSANIKLAVHFFQQEKTLAHQKYLRFIQGLLMVFIIALSQSSDTVQSYLHENLQNLLGADVVITQQESLNNNQQQEIENIARALVVTQQVSSTLTHNGLWQRAQIKAVGDGYPLQGQLSIADSPQGDVQGVYSGPNIGEIWLDARLLVGLSVNVGEYLTLAEQSFLVAKVLVHEPDRLMEGHNVDMRAMINAADITKLGFPAEQVQYRYLITANKQQSTALIQWQKDNLPGAQLHHKQGAHPLALFWKRTENFIGLTSIILFFMAAIALEQLSQTQIHKEQYFSAICLSLGSSLKSCIQLSVVKWCLSFATLLPAVLVVSALFYGAVVIWLQATFVEITWQWNTWLAIKSVAAMAIILMIMQLPVWLSLKSSTVAQLVNPPKTDSNLLLTKISSVVVLCAIAFAYSDNGLLTAMVVSSIAVSICLMIIISWLSLTIGEKVSQRFSGLVPFTLFMMKQRLLAKSTQILGIGLCTFLLLFTLMLLKDLGNTMSAYQRQHDGNLLISQATQTQMLDIEQLASTENIEIRQVKPYLRAKLIKINDTPLDEFSQKPSDSLSTLGRAIRLHWSQDIPANNRIVEGSWWAENTENWQQISVEQEIMTDLGLNIGDRFTLFINQQAIDFTIVASHVYRSGGGSITFWLQMPTAAIDHIHAPIFNMASIELSQTQWPLLNQLWQKHPTLRMVSLKEMTERFDRILAMVTQVISGFSLLIIILASVVILASVQTLEDKEKKKNSIIMSFGFNKPTCLKLNIIEWLFTAAIAALGAISGTYLAGMMIYQSQFSIAYQPNFWWLLATLTLILALVTSFGIYASRKSLKTSIRQLLAEN